MGLQNNTPTVTWLSITGTTVTHNDTVYSIEDIKTNKEFIYWESTNPNKFRVTDDDLGVSGTRYLLFKNNRGEGIKVPNDSILVAFDGNTSKIAEDEIFSLTEKVGVHDGKFVSVINDIDGIEQTVGTWSAEDGSIAENISSIKQDTYNIDLEVKDTTRQFNEEKSSNKLRDDINKSLIDFNTEIGTLSSKFYSFSKNNVIDSSETTYINTQLSLIDSKISEVNLRVGEAISLADTQGQTTQRDAMTTEKDRLNTTYTNLKDSISSAIIDGVTTSLEVVGIVNLFSKCNTDIVTLKNTVDDFIFLGTGGKVVEELAKISIKSDEITLGVSHSEEVLKTVLGVEKNILQGQITDYKNANYKLKDKVSEVSVDGLADESEKTALTTEITKVDDERADITAKYNELYANARISTAVRNALEVEYDSFNNKCIETNTKINNVVADGFINSVEKNEIDALLNESVAKVLSLQAKMCQAMDDIDVNTASWSLAQEKLALQQEISDVDTKVGDLNTYVDGTFKDNTLDGTERKSIKQNLDNISIQKADVDSLYSIIYNDVHLLGTPKTELLSAYNDFVSKYDDLDVVVDGILNKAELIDDTDRANYDTAISNLKTSIGVLTSKFKNAENNISENMASGLIDNLQIGGVNLFRYGSFEGLNNDLNNHPYTSWSHVNDSDGSSCSIIDIPSTDKIPFVKAVYMKNDNIANTVGLSETVYTNAKANTFKGKNLTVSFWCKYKNIVQGDQSWRNLRFGELIIRYKKADGSEAWTYPNVLNIGSGSNEVWTKYTKTIGIDHPDAVEIIEIYFKFLMEGCTGESWVTGIKLEEGSKITSWSPSPADVESQIQQADNKAQEVTDKVSDLSNDDKLTPSEKQQLKKELDIITNEKTNIESQADIFSIAKTTYQTHYNNLYNLVNPLLSDLNSTSDIDGADIRLKFSNYYKYKAELLKDIESASKGYVVGVEDKADEVIGKVDDIASDSKITPSEKIQLKKELDIITNEKTNIELQADIYGVLKTNYQSAYTDLYNLVNPLVDNLTTTSDVNGEDIRVKFKNYYNYKADLLKNITDIAKNYVSSRGQNLVTNGTGLLGTNFNFSSFEFDGSDAYYSNGSFKDSTYYITRFNDELMPVDVDKTYRFSLMAKCDPYVGAKYYAGIAPYDCDGNSISPYHHMYFPNTLTTLAQDLKPGDTKVYLTDASNYRNSAGTSTHFRALIFWGYKNSLGYEYPTEYYSRYYSGYDAWSDGGVNYTDNSITLRVPWNYDNPNDPEGIWRAGTQLSNANSGSGYKYITVGNAMIPSDWTPYSGTIGGVDLTGTNVQNQFPPGTASVKVMFLNNRNAVGSTVWYSNLKFGVDIASQDDVTAIDNSLADMADDNKITPVEKLKLKKDWDIIVGEKPTIDSEADLYSVSKTAYGTTYTTLSGYVTPLLTDLTTTQTIDGDTIRLYFTNYYTEKAELLKEISNASMVYIDDSIDNIQMGGRNIVPNSSFNMYDTDNVNRPYQWSTMGGSVEWNSSPSTGGIAPNLVGNRYLWFKSNDSAERCIKSDRFHLKPSTDYILTYYVRCDSGAEAEIFVLASSTINVITDETSDYDLAYNTPKNTDTGFTKKEFKFTTSGSAKTGYIRIDNNLGLGKAIRISSIMLEEGTKPTDWTPAPEDIAGELGDLTDAIGSLDDTMNGAFKDGVLSDAEKTAIKQNLQTIENEKIEVDKQHSTVYNNIKLLGTAKTNLATANTNYNTTYDTLVTTINTILNKAGLVDSIDQTNLTTAFTNYRTNSGIYAQRLNEAIDSIAEKKSADAETNSKSYTDSKVTILNDSIALKVEQTDITNAINNLRTMAKLNGVELLNLTYQKDIDVEEDKKPFASGSYAIVPATEIGGNANEQNYIKTINASFLYSPLIACNPNGTQYARVSVYNQSTNDGTVYMQCCYYDKDKVALATNETALTIIGSVSNTSANTWQTHEGYLDPVSPTDIRQKAVYMRVRVLTRYSGKTGTTYLKDLSWKQLSPHTVSDTETRISNAEIKIKDNSIVSIVEEHSTKLINADTKADNLLNNTLGLGMKVNYSDFTTINNGEIYLHGYDDKGNPSDVDGWMMWNSEKITVPKIMFNPNGVPPLNQEIYMMYSTLSSSWFNVWYDLTELQWKYTERSAGTIYNLVWNEDAQIVVGHYIASSSENIKTATLYETPLNYRQATTMSTSSSKSELKQLSDSITMKVQQERSANIYKVRYIRDYLNGSTANTGNHWNEIKVIDNQGNNVALDKVVTTSLATDPTNISDLVDGVTHYSPYVSVSSGLQWVQVDLGSVHQDIDNIIVWHYWSDGRRYYHTKTQVSEDGTNWIDLFDSDIEGEYNETKNGHSIKVNQSANTRTGIATFDDGGLKVEHSDSNTYTIVDSGSFRVENVDGGTNVASFGATSNIPNIESSGTINGNLIYGTNIINTQKSVTYYVDLANGNDSNSGTSSSKFKTIQKALDSLGKYLDQDVTVDIYVYGIGSQEVRVRGFNGAGIIQIRFMNNSKLYCSLFDIRECTCRLLIRGEDPWSSSIGQIINGDTGTCVYVRACSYVELYHMCLCGTGKGNGYGVSATYGSSVYVNSCEIDRFKCSINATHKGRISLYNTKGSDLDYIGIGSNFGEVYLQENYGTIPNAPEFATSGATWTHTIGGGSGCTKTNGTIYPPSYVPPEPPEPTPNTREWSFNKIWSDETLYGWSDKNELIQGRYDGWGTGRWTGYMQMDDDFADIRSAISGGTNLSGRLYVQRTTSSGNAVDSHLCLYGSDGTVITTTTDIDRGQGIWVNLSSTVVGKIQSGAIKYFYLKADTSNALTYFKCESNAKIELTYTK